MNQTIEFTRPDGKKAPGYYVAPEHADGAPGLVLIEEWWGVTDHMKRLAERFAKNGFRVIVPDLYRGRTAAVGDEANHLMEGLDFGDAATQDVRGAAQYLLSSGSAKVGVMGFCMGGALTLLAAMYDPEFSAAVTFYGFPPPEAGDLGAIKIPVQGHWGERDSFFGMDRVNDIEKRFKEIGVPYEFHRYDAEHGFNNPNEQGNSGLGHYHEEHSERSLHRANDFLKKHLA